MRRPFKKGDVVINKENRAVIVVPMLVTSVYGDTFECISAHGVYLIYKIKDFEKKEIYTLKISEEEFDRIKRGGYILKHKLIPAWEWLKVLFDIGKANVVKLYTKSGRRIYVELADVQKVTAEKVIKESANGTLIKKIFYIRYMINKKLFGENA